MMAVSDRLDAGRLGNQCYLGASNRQQGPAASNLEPMSNAKSYAPKEIRRVRLLGRASRSAARMPCAVSRMSTASSAFAVDSNAPRCVSTSATTARPSHLDTTTPRRPSRSRQGRLYGKNQH